MSIQNKLEHKYFHSDKYLSGNYKYDYRVTDAFNDNKLFLVTLQMSQII